MILTQHYDLIGHVSAIMVKDLKGVEQFSAELLEHADGTVLAWDPQTRIVTITASNGLWRYQIIDDETNTLTGTLIP